MSNLVRVKVKRNRKYTTINLTAVEDPNLTWAAKGLHLYLMSRPTNWEIRSKDLERRALNGRYALQSALELLKKHNYLTVTRLRDDKGKFIGIQYLVSEVPEEPQEEDAHMWENLESGFPCSGETELYSNNQYSSNKHNSKHNQPSNVDSRDILGGIVKGGDRTEPTNGVAKTSDAGFSVSLEKKAFGEDGYVKLFEKQLQSLLKKLGEERTCLEIDNLNDYIGQIGEAAANKKYKSHYHVILNWSRNPRMDANTATGKRQSIYETKSERNIRLLQDRDKLLQVLYPDDNNRQKPAELPPGNLVATASDRNGGGLERDPGTDLDEYFTQLVRGRKQNKGDEKLPDRT